MKRIVKIFGLFLVSGLILTSCGSDDDDPWVPNQKTITYEYSSTIRGLKGTTVINNLSSLTLEEILASEGIDAKNFISAEMQNTGSYFKVEGLKAMESQPSLKDIVFNVGTSSPIDLGTCAPNATGVNEFPSDEDQSTNNDLKLINSVFDDIKGSKKKAEMKMTFTPTEDIDGNNVKMIIVIRATYRYKVYSD